MSWYSLTFTFNNINHNYYFNIDVDNFNIISIHDSNSKIKASSSILRDRGHYFDIYPDDPKNLYQDNTNFSFYILNSNILVSERLNKIKNDKCILMHCIYIHLSFFILFNLS